MSLRSSGLRRLRANSELVNRIKLICPVQGARSRDPLAHPGYDAFSVIASSDRG
jgi:hypothetical protein